LRTATLYGLLLHNPQQLLGAQGDELYRALTALRQQHLVKKIGVSVYGPEELELLYPRFEFDMIQAPFNVIDRRIATSGWLERLHEAGVEVHVRSAFLQGLLLMDDSTRPAQFDKWQPLWTQWHRWLDDHELSPLQACLNFALSHPEIDHVVIGVDSQAQLKEILMTNGATAPKAPQTLMSADPDLVNPSRWTA
jgi:aryl-alcohol dehydrogenase-like predicted oxidoreductase